MTMHTSRIHLPTRPVVLHRRTYRGHGLLWWLALGLVLLALIWAYNYTSVGRSIDRELFGSGTAIHNILNPGDGGNKRGSELGAASVRQGDPRDQRTNNDPVPGCYDPDTDEFYEGTCPPSSPGPEPSFVPPPVTDGPCKDMADSVGGPAHKWWEIQNPDGSSIPNTCILREADDSDGVPGWEVYIHEGHNAHVWLYDCTKVNCHVAVTVVGPAWIDGGFLASRMSYYKMDGAYSATHRGQWTFGQLDGSDTDSNCGWVDVGTPVPLCNNPTGLWRGDFPEGASQGGGRPGRGNQGRGNQADCTVSVLRSAIDGNVRLVQRIPPNGAEFEATGRNATFRTMGGKFHVISNAGKITSGRVTAKIASVYCAP